MPTLPLIFYLIYRQIFSPKTVSMTITEHH